MPRGFNTMADIINTTTDGVDFDRMWGELQAAVTLRNQHRSAIQTLLSNPTSSQALEVAQAAGGDDFEDASEFGVPQGVRPSPATVLLGFPFKWRDLATRFTWRALANMSSSQVSAIANNALEADNRQTFIAAMRALLTQTTIATRPVNPEGTTIFPLWDGQTDATPPSYANTTFAAGHTHFLTTQSATPDGLDLRDLIRHVTHHGYGVNPGSQMVVFCNPTEGATIRNLRVANGSPFDFISSEQAPAYLTTEQVVGQRPPGSYGGLTVIGGFGNAWIIEDDFVPVGYLIAAATGGGDSTDNVLAMRQHANPGLQGLRLFGGSNADYPLVESYYTRGFGFAVAHRGAAACMQVTTSTTYTSPVIS